MNVAIIPARGGSKRIPKKNIKSFCGKPIIAWSIDAAKQSKLFDHIIVSTDDQEIANFALEYGAEVPFIRPAKLSNDIVGTSDVIKHSTYWIINNICKPKFVCTIYATAPFITSEIIVGSFNVLQKNDCKIVFTATSYSFPIQRAFKITKSNRVKMFQPENFSTRSQDLEPSYHDAGQIYWSKTDAILNDVQTFSEDSIPFILPNSCVQDIDSEEDWINAELKFEILNRKNDF